jgi:hypothetical protein
MEKILKFAVPAFVLALLAVGFITYAPYLAFVFKAAGYGLERFELIASAIVGLGLIGFGIKKYQVEQDAKKIIVYIALGAFIFLGFWFGIPAQLKVDAEDMKTLHDLIFPVK